MIFLTPLADLTVGRQAITWGNSTLFAVVDFWTQFSPFERDTSQKRGVDALRVISYPGEFEVDAVVVDRGSLNLVSGGIRVTTTFDEIDGYVATAKSYETLYAAVGAQLDWSSSRVHTEAALPIEIDDVRVRLPTWTAGIDYFASSDLMLGLEYHLRGRGTSSAADYLERLSGDSTTRGEDYLLGRHYAGVTASYRLRPDVTAAVAAIGNLTDPSVLVLPSIQYAIGDQGRLELVAYQAFGNRPRLALPPELTSEFGTYPNLYLVQISMYL